jgi:hypothetical protein
MDMRDQPRNENPEQIQYRGDDGRATHRNGDVVSHTAVGAALVA